jgi:hypothetical protein
MRISPRRVAVAAAPAATTAGAWMSQKFWPAEVFSHYSPAPKSDRLGRPSAGGAAQDRTRHSGHAKRRPIQARSYTLSFLLIDAHRNATKV